jgi:hypothetical protein
MNAATVQKLEAIRSHLNERRRGKPGTPKGIVHGAMSQSRAEDALKKFGIYLQTRGGPGGKGIVAVVKGKTYPVKDILKKFGFQFKNFKPEPYWYNPKGLKLNYNELYHAMAKAMHKGQKSEEVEDIEESKFTIKQAEKMGRDAFKRGKKAVPVHDPVFMKALERYLKGMKQRVFGASEPFLAAWGKGWHSANVAAPVESMTSPVTLLRLVEIREQLESECIPCLGESDEVVDAATIKAKAATTQDEWVRIFDKLKSKQVIYLSMKYPSTGYAKFLVGRRSKAKKPRWWSENITLLPGDGSKVPTYAKYRLWKSKKGEISASHGDMAVFLTGIYVP